MKNSVKLSFVLLVGLNLPLLSYAQIETSCNFSEVINPRRAPIIEKTLQGHLGELKNKLQEKDTSQWEKEASFYQRQIQWTQDRGSRLLEKRWGMVENYFRLREKKERFENDFETLGKESRNNTEEIYFQSLPFDIQYTKSRMEGIAEDIKEINSYLDIEDPCFGQSEDPENLVEKRVRLKKRLENLREEQKKHEANPHNPGRLQYIKDSAIPSVEKQIKKVEESLNNYIKVRGRSDLESKLKELNIILETL